MARIVKDPVVLTTSLQTIHIINSGVQGTQQTFTAWNSDAGAREVHFNFVPNGGSAALANQIAGTTGKNIVPAGESRTYKWEHFLKAGDFIQAKCSVNSKMSLRSSFLEEAP